MALAIIAKTMPAASRHIKTASLMRAGRQVRPRFLPDSEPRNTGHYSLVTGSAPASAKSIA
jgi:hypothetical protein